MRLALLTRLPTQRSRRRWLVLVLPEFAACATPAVLGAALNWPWWLTYTLILPGATWYLATEGKRRYVAAQKAGKQSLVDRVPTISVLSFFVLLALLGDGAFGTRRYCAGIGVIALILQDLWLNVRNPASHQHFGLRSE